MKKINRKGFTIVELVIVIAVIAILSAVLIPTFSNLIRKANISSDTVLSKNLNTALNVYEVENGIDDFAEVLEAIKENGYLIANLNAKTNGCFFVWESESNQILLVDSENNYEVLFSLKEYAPIGSTWHFAISNKEIAKKVKTDLPSVTIKQTIATMDDLKDMLIAGGEVYLDESITLDDENLISLNEDNKVVTINLGNALLNTNGILKDKTPISVENGTLNINGGIIGAAGSYVDSDGKVVNTPISVEENGSVNIDGTIFNVAENGYLFLNGNNTVKNATINTEFIGIYARGNNVVENTTINSKDRIIWACNHNEDSNTGLITIKSGTYVGGSAKYGAITTCGSFVKIEGGNFTSNEGAALFNIHNNGTIAQRSTIVITGGTFNGVDFADLTEDQWNEFCSVTSKATISADGKTVTISFK